jgi:hypothetical protein
MGHFDPGTPLSRDSDEDKVQAMSSTRRTIAFTEPRDRMEESPQWILDALKVSTMRTNSVPKLTSIM